MGFFSILLDILAILAIIIFGSFIVVVIADLILCMFDDHEGIIFRRGKKADKNKKTETNDATKVKKDDIVVYSNQANPNGNIQKAEQIDKKDVVDGNVVSEVDFDKAIEEQQAINNRRGVRSPEPAPKKPEPKPQPKNDDDLFWNIDEDKEFTNLLDDVIKEAKNDGKKQKEVVVAKPKKEDDETKKALAELQALKEEQQKEIEEIRKMKEDFAREKEEQIAMLRANLDKAKEEELERIKQEAIREQEKLQAEQAQIEEDQIKEVVVEQNSEPIVKETIIKDEEELNKLKLKNLMRMNNRLSKIIRDTEKLQLQKQREQERLALEKEKLLLKEQQSKQREQEALQREQERLLAEREKQQKLEEEQRQREQEKRAEIQRQNKERLLKQSEALRKRNEINRKLQEASKKAGKYKLDNAIVKVTKELVSPETQIIEETVTTVEETIPGTDTTIKTVEKEPMKVTVKPIFAKEYYEQKLEELDTELRDAEKELRTNKSEYIPLTRIYKAYDRDSEKLRKKEIQVAKQKVSLYGINSTKIDPAKKAKLDENLATLSELKDSVAHCEEVIKKNKDRYPVLEKNNKLILKQIDRINEDIKVCEKAISYYNKKKD